MNFLERIPTAWLLAGAGLGCLVLWAAPGWTPASMHRDNASEATRLGDSRLSSPGDAGASTQLPSRVLDPLANPAATPVSISSADAPLRADDRSPALTPQEKIPTAR